MNSIISVDRSVRPSYPAWVKEVLHPKLENTGPTEFDTGKLEKWLHDDQRNGVATGQGVYNYLKTSGALKDCAGLRDLEEIQKKGLAFLRRHFGRKVVYGWKSVVRSSVDDLLRVPCLDVYGYEVVVEWSWLGHDWNCWPALRFPSNQVA